MSDQVSTILQKPKVDDTEKQPDTVFRTLLESSLPPEEVSQTRLQHEAISLTAAGIETTMRALSLACFHIIANPPVHQRLREELYAAIPDVSNHPSWDTLSQLPYLSACIEEGKSNSFSSLNRKKRKEKESSKPVQPSASPTVPHSASPGQPTCPSPIKPGLSRPT